MLFLFFTTRERRGEQSQVAAVLVAIRRCFVSQLEY
jgi:hypothetical protein